MLKNLKGAALPNVPRPPPSTGKQKENQVTTDNAAQCSVTSIYGANIGDLYRKVTATWCKSPVSHSFAISVESPCDDQSHNTCKIDLNGWQFWGKKGLKNIEIDGERVDIYWDFRETKFNASPEPCSDYYVAMVCDEKVVLVIGDMKKDALKRTKKKLSLIDPNLLCKQEHICGKRLFCSKTKLGEGIQEHDIIIENCLSDPDDPEMWVTIDGTTIIRVMNLHWRFRGNEIVTVNKTPIQIFWDVHDWLYNKSSSSHGLFIFIPGEPDSNSIINSDDDCNINIPKFCYVLYAWKTE
ncbi:hypothetical protein ERO13_D05G385800v2 [Gossypium hirsutum]|uniref:DUF868 domain-containing protein n=3 Tax=Gossypium TaxID=3633 RepID=A0A1U8J8I4_GOSHI|nr:uncharacterized protein LOC107903416 [Gossypium hirsutum]KAB2033111.1 hypothetical protein ES319_D05G425800v1 [Gossypium barbadense]KAG4150268.1 hypothetical protein ERO13_D05G385800v2 [Gossypium hirsutum]TYG72148.1 hypothetical protein ES288_D05G456600v1 [Gossypium darwinii]